jgi:hypothetical protein
MTNLYNQFNGSYSNFMTNIQNLNQKLEIDGVAVIPRVLTDEECFNMVSGIWDYFEHISKEWEIPIDRNNSATLRGIYSLFPLHSNFIIPVTRMSILETPKLFTTIVLSNFTWGHLISWTNLSAF